MDIGVLTILSTLLVVVGLVMVVIQWWREDRTAGGEAEPASESGGVTSAIDRLFDLIADSIGDPRRWGFALIALGLVGLIVDQALAWDQA